MSCCLVGDLYHKNHCFCLIGRIIISSLDGRSFSIWGDGSDCLSVPSRWPSFHCEKYYGQGVGASPPTPEPGAVAPDLALVVHHHAVGTVVPDDIVVAPHEPLDPSAVEEFLRFFDHPVD